MAPVVAVPRLGHLRYIIYHAVFQQKHPARASSRARNTFNTHCESAGLLLEKKWQLYSLTLLQLWPLTCRGQPRSVRIQPRKPGFWHFLGFIVSVVFEDECRCRSDSETSGVMSHAARRGTRCRRRGKAGVVLMCQKGTLRYS